MIRLDEDHHVHTTFSDGRGTVSEMAEQARHVGLRQIGLADHVRRDSDWLDAYVAEVERVRAHTACDAALSPEDWPVTYSAN